MLKLASKTICLSLIGSFTALEAYQKHQKDGFFVEAGFETGLLQGTQTQEQTIATTQEKPKPKPKPKPITPQSTYGKYYISQSTVLKNATELFAEDNITNLTFYSLTPVYVTAYNQESAEEAGYGDSSLIMIQNFLPYNLNNIELSYTDAQGNVVSLGVIETIPKQSQIILPASLFNDPQLNADGFQQLQTTTTRFSDASTQNLFDKLSKVTTNLQMTYINYNQFSSGNGTGSKPPCPPYENQENCTAKVPPFTSQDAKNLTNLMLNMMAVFDSKSWEDAVKNAPFQFSDNNLSKPCYSDYSTCVNPYNDGLVDPKLIAKNAGDEYNIENGQTGSVILTPQDVIYSYRVTNNLYVNLLPPRGGDLGLGSQYGGPNGPGDDGTNFGALGILSPFLDPEILFGKELNKVAIMQLRDIIHEYGHTLGYTHNGNMTYQRVRMCEENNGPEERCKGGKIEQVNGQEVQVFDNGHEVRDTDGSFYDVCSRFGGQGQPAFPSSYPNSIYTDCSQVPAGLIGVTSAVWQQLIDQNALPVDYTNLSSQTNYLNASLNTQDFATTMLSAISQSLSSTKSSTTTYRTSKTSRPFGAPLLGVNLKMGYQKYFNDYLGLSSYGIIKYNYAQANNEKIQQLSYGVGMDVLFDFITNYTNEKNPKNNLTKKVFTSSLGVFGGLRGLYNSYYLLNQYKGSGNLNVTGGLNYRYKHSKYSVGISVPLVQLKSRVVSSDGSTTNSITLNEGGSHFKVFFNYGWIF
ncbi:membrane protein [Helicobacter pylori X47-2AL]|uniref:Membrane protein n=1 Tax=Helicobacter pylori X47-2AL TaxID=1386083 RepID=V6LHS4_HELPX|nr:outer membrane beta-barrel protein [Helicobacter pylori]EST40394.1 membrane protein [Helicobacter pylori X47-2AL]MUT74660.1 outer membrane beta-barrel protein [Helicobacter pylori]MUT82232.1 outer membrane beta-barrel protein [Helicobacter pylori]